MSTPLLPPTFRRRPVVIHTAIFGACIALLVTLPGVWLGSLWDNSETAYSEVAREILLTHDTIVMHLNMQPWFIQPPLYFWFSALAATLFGITTFAFRLPSVIATAIMGALFAAFCVRIFGVRCARYAALILSTMLMQAVIGRMAIMDAMLDAAVTVTIISWARACLPSEDTDTRGSAWIVGTIAAAIGVLTKGPVALAVPLLVIVPWYFWERRHAYTLAPPLSSVILGGIAFIAITLPWYAMLNIENPAGLHDLVFHYTVGRYVGTIEKQTGPIYYYLPVVILGTFPWTSVFFAALWKAIREPFFVRAATGKQGSIMRLALVWTFAPLIFFSFAQTKLPNYVALILPAIALLAARWLDLILPKRRSQARGAFLTVPVIMMLLIVAMQVFARSNSLNAAYQALSGYASAYMLCILVGAIAAYILLLRRRQAIYAPFALAFGTIAAMWIVAFGALPAADRFKPIMPLAAIINHMRQPGDIVALQGVNGTNSLMFYTHPPIIELDSPDTPNSVPEHDPALAYCSATRLLLVAPTERPRPDPLYGRSRRILASAGKDALFLIDGPPCRETAP